MQRGLTFAALCLLGVLFGPIQSAFADFTLTILHTNDFHSRIEPITKYDSGCSETGNAKGKCFGGSARLATAIRARRAAAGPSILVDGGDQFQGTLFYTTYKGRAAAEMMNALGYDAMTVGNHEFDDGPAILRAFMNTVSFPVLLANADVSKEPALADVLKPSTILERGGEKIGLIGLAPADTDEASSPGRNISFSDPALALKREIAKLETAGIDKIIVLSHSGFTVDREVAAAVNGIDVIVGGHSNTYLSNSSDRAAGPYPTWVSTPDGGRTAIVQAYAYGKFLGELTVSFDDDGVVREAVGEPIIMDSKVPEDVALRTRIGELAIPFAALRAKVVGQASAEIAGDKAGCRGGECRMGNLVADAMLDRVRSQGVTIAIQNGGGLRASIDAGDVTMGEVLTVLPFLNTLSTFQLEGRHVRGALEHGVSQVEKGAGRFPQVAGLRYAWDAAAPPGGRIRDVLVKQGDDWVAIDEQAVYTLVTNNYLRRGGDGYKMFSEHGMNAYDYGPNLETVVADYLARNTPYTPYVDGRIRRVE